METTALNAQIDTTSIKMEFAVKSKEIASNSTSNKVFAKNVTRDIQLLMVAVKR